MERKASAQWNGGLKDGKGAVSTAGGALKGVPDSCAMRFGDTPGTNPEELVAAAHAGCFSMALSGELEKIGYRPERIETKATLNFDKADAGWTVKSIHLDVTAKVPGADPAKFQTAVEAAGAGIENPWRVRARKIGPRNRVRGRSVRGPSRDDGGPRHGH